MEIDGITVGKIAAEMTERSEQIVDDGNLMARGARCVLALSEKLAEAISGCVSNVDLDLEPGMIEMVEPGARVEVERTPLGLRPDWVVATKRIEEIQAAMSRYVDADVAIPRDWFDELEWQSRLLDRSRENRKK